MDNVFAPFEVKFVDSGAAGEFEGYGAVFSNQDSHGDVIQPGAFRDTLAERKAAGRSLPMHVMHGILGGDGVPVGVWKSVAEDDNGLHVKGKISGVNTDAGKLLHERVKDGALGGLSIGFTVKKNGAVYGQNPGEPRRTLKSVHLHEISLVSDPSNAKARVMSVKSAASADTTTAASSIAAAMRLHDKSMGDSYSYSNPKDKAQLMNHLRDAHSALTGSRAPDGLDGWKSAISFNEFKDGLRTTFGISEEEAQAFAEHAYKTSTRKRDGEMADAGVEAVSAAISGFTLPTFGA